MGSSTIRTPVIPVEFRELVNREVAADEKVLWFGAARPRAFRLAGILLVLFGIPWTAFSIFWIAVAWAGASQMGAGILGMVFPLFGLPFLLVGLALLSSPFWLARKAKKSCYILTDHRAIVVAAGFFGSRMIKSFGPEQLTTITRTEHSDGSSDLVFEEFTTGHGDHHTRTRLGFIAINNVHDVEQLIIQMVNDNRATPAAQ